MQANEGIIIVEKKILQRRFSYHFFHVIRIFDNKWIYSVKTKLYRFCLGIA